MPQKMKTPAAKYLEKRADLESRPLVSGALDRIEQAVVIPVRKERDDLPRTLASLARNPKEDLERSLIVCVVNDPGAADDAEAAEENLETLELLGALVAGQGPADLAGLRMAYVDAASEGHALSSKEGVGLARKIGLDWGLDVLERNAAGRGALISLDADTVVEPNYLSVLNGHFGRDGAWAAAVAYAHPIEGAPEAQAGILCYELFLRYYVLGLRHAGSPYAFHAIGSALACTPQAYAAVSGMNRRQGGEDFYFAQELAKAGPFEHITATTVHPSGRPSNRVPFGTGPRVRRFIEGTQNEYMLYHPESYRILKTWLTSVTSRPASSGSGLLSETEPVSPALRSFLEAQRFERIWGRIQANASDEAMVLAQFHRWFDGFRTLKLLHHLRDHGLPRQPMFKAIETMLRWVDSPYDVPAAIEQDLEAQTGLLNHLRALAGSGIAEIRGDD